METGHVALIISALGLILVVIEKIFGGGHSLANRFAKLDKETSEIVSKLRADIDDKMMILRNEFTRKIDEYEDVNNVGIEALKSNIHALQLGLLEFRAKMAEEYMPRGDYRTGNADIRREVHDGFDEIKKRLDRIEGSMMHRSED